MSYLLSEDQAKAIREIGAWYKSKSSPYFTMGGYAGTGKTTLIAYLRQALGDFDEDASVAFCAYTGKATRVLADRLRDKKVLKRGDSVSTIHGLIYTTEESADGNPKWLKRDRLDRDLVIVDEASMVDRDIWEDLLSFKIPVLAVGDHGQLPPIGSSFYLMERPMVRLDRIFRQAAGSPIIEVATLARQNGVIPVKEFGPDVVKLDQKDPESGVRVQELLENWRPELLILCGYNGTRVKLNHTIREMRDITSPEPVSGDQVVCLRNNRTKHLYNGMLGRIIRVRGASGSEGHDWYEAEIELEGEDYIYTGNIYKPQFGARETIKDVPLAPDGQRGDLWDFGYALTVHKAQGSQAESVLVFEERFPKSTDEDWRRWLYTAVTRAREKLVVVGR